MCQHAKKGHLAGPFWLELAISDLRFVYHGVLIQDAIRSMREACALRHISINTEKTYIYWLARYGSFLKDAKLGAMPSEKKIEGFLTRLALAGVSASTQNQAFNALLLFYRDVLKQELGR